MPFHSLVKGTQPPSFSSWIPLSVRPLVLTTLLSTVRFPISVKVGTWQPWPGWLSWLDCHLVTKTLQVLFLARAHTWVLGSIPRHVWEAANWCFPLSLPLSLKAKKKYPWVKIKKKNREVTDGHSGQGHSSQYCNSQYGRSWIKNCRDCLQWSSLAMEKSHNGRSPLN